MKVTVDFPTSQSVMDIGATFPARDLALAGYDITKRTKQRQRSPERICPVCGTAFTPLCNSYQYKLIIPERLVGRFPYLKKRKQTGVYYFCRYNCWRAAERIVTAGREIRRVCPWCGKPFIARTMRTHYCSAQCGQQAYQAGLRVKDEG